MKLTNKQKRKIKRRVDLELGVKPYKSKIHKNKKKYNRTKKHNNDEYLFRLYIFSLRISFKRHCKIYERKN